MNVLYANNRQIKKNIAKGGEYLKAGLTNATMKCVSDEFTALDHIPPGTMIEVAALSTGSVPAFVVIEVTENLSGMIGTRARPTLYGHFEAKRNIPCVVMPVHPNTPLEASGEVFIVLGDILSPAAQIKIKLMFT